MSERETKMRERRQGSKYLYRDMKGGIRCGEGGGEWWHRVVEYSSKELLTQKRDVMLGE